MFDQFGSILTQMVILFGAIGVGYGCKCWNLMDADFDRKLSRLVLNATLPALILASVLTADELPDSALMLEIIGLSCLSFAILIAAAFLIVFLLRIPDGHRGVYRFMLIFGNTGFIGYPVLMAIFGQQAVIYAVVYNLPFNFIVFTLGAWLIASDNATGVKVRMSAKQFVTPCNIASIIALVLALAGVHSVPVLGDALSTIGDFTTPATLLIVGSSLGNMPAKSLLGGPKLWFTSLMRLAAVPVLIYFAMSQFASGQLLTVLVVLAAMPVATNGTMLCYQYHGDAKAMAQGTFVTTVLSLVSIPLLVTIVSTL